MPTIISGSSPATSAPLTLNQSLKMSFQLAVQGAGAVSSTAVIEGSHDGQGWINIATLSAGGTNYAADGGTFETFFPQVRARLTAVTGTATVYWGS
jgi:hypothetical protein